MKSFILLIASLFLLSTCANWEDSGSFVTVNCSECYSEKPTEADLIIYLSEEYGDVSLTIFKGNIENNNIVFEDTVPGEKFYLYVPTNEFYSAKATYKNDSQTIIAHDGSKLIVIRRTEECSDYCWTIHGGRLRLEIDN